MAIRIHPIDQRMTAPAARFIESWGPDDAYDRFGSAGINGQQWLEHALTKHERPAFVALNGNEVIGLLDHAEADGATHFGIVVDSRFRRLAVGTALVASLLHSRSIRRPILADCTNSNRAAMALLRRCRFEAIADDRYETTWRHE
jgi:ribosomal protein S18 acetylase RimI-like enzyme